MAEWIPWSQARSYAEGISKFLIGETTMILCRFNSKTKINIKETRSRRVKERMESDDLPSTAFPLKERESRTVKRVPFSRVFFSWFRICLTWMLGFGILKQNGGQIREYMGYGLPKKNIRIAGFSEIKDGVMGSEDRIRYPQVISSWYPRVPNQLNVDSMS